MVLSSRSLCSCVREIDWALVFLHSINAGFGRVCIGVGVGGGDGGWTMFCSVQGLLSALCSRVVLGGARGPCGAGD